MGGTSFVNGLGFVSINKCKRLKNQPLIAFLYCNFMKKSHIDKALAKRLDQRELHFDVLNQIN
jgi:hypothetical protein